MGAEKPGEERKGGWLVGGIWQMRYPNCFPAVQCKAPNDEVLLQGGFYWWALDICEAVSPNNVKSFCAGGHFVMQKTGWCLPGFPQKLFPETG